MTIEGMVSTIIPVYNRSGMLREAVASVLAQDYRPIEIIVVDDGSTDETAREVDSFMATHPDVIRAVHRDNGGPGLARESGRQLARGEFIQYLDSDDLLLPGKFTTQVGALRSREECGVAYGVTRYRDANGNEDESLRKGDRERHHYMFPRMLLQRWWDTPNPLYRTAVCTRVGAWADLRVEEDWEYDCRVAALGLPLAYVPEYVCEVRDHTDGRLCRGQPLDPVRLRDRASAHQQVYRNARRAGIEDASEAMSVFSRTLFLLARQCGAAGLVIESRELFDLARRAADTARARALDFRLYAAVASVIGWRNVGRLGVWIDELR